MGVITVEVKCLNPTFSHHSEIRIYLLCHKVKQISEERTKHAFPDVLTEEKQYKKLSNLLQKMKKEEIVYVCGSTVHAEWFLVE